MVESQLRKKSAETQLKLQAASKSNLFCSFNVVLYYNISFTHILNSLYAVEFPLMFPHFNAFNVKL
jgi:hypothetical protein